MFQHAVTKSGRVEANTFSLGTVVLVSNEANVRVLVSFYLAPESGKVNGNLSIRRNLMRVDKKMHKELY